MSSKKIFQTKNYQMFQRSDDNRPADMSKHKKLEDSMRAYGFLSCFPIAVVRNNGHLIVKDGQHRLMIAESLGLPVSYVEETVDFDIAKVNSAAKGWALRDYADMYAANGVSSYREGLAFAQQHKIPIGMAFSLLAGTTSFNNCYNSFLDGSFKVKDRKWAEAVADIYAPVVALCPRLKNARFIEACMSVCRVKDFNAKRLIQGAERARHLLVPYATKDACLDMIEEIYNFGRRDLVGLKTAALMAMRDRNPSAKKGEGDAA